MNKIYLHTVALLAGTLVTAPAIANSGFYVSGKAGVSSIQIKKLKLDDYDFPGGYSEHLNWGDKSKTGMNIGLQGGYNFATDYNVPIRIELDYTFRPESKISQIDHNRDNNGIIIDSDVNLKTKTTLHSALINIYYDFDTGTNFTPYVGAGAGFSVISTKYSISNPAGDFDGSTSKNTTEFAWALAAGVSYKIDENLALDLGYRYLDAGELKISDSIDNFGDEKLTMKVKSHDVSIGIRYSF